MMLSVDCRPLSLQTGSVTRKFRSFDRVISAAACFAARHRNHTAMIYAVWMLHIADFSDQWWGLLAMRTGHYHGITFFTPGRSAFGVSPCRPHPNHCRKCAYDTIQIWHNILQHDLGIVDQKGLELGSQRPRNHARKNFVNNRTVGDVMFQKPIGFRGWCTTFIGSSLCGRPFVVRRICRTTSVHA